MSETDGRHPWKRSAFEVREAVADLIASIPHTYPADRMLVASETHDHLHRYVIEYRQVLKPLRDELNVNDDATHPWEAKLGTVHIPESSQELQLGDGSGLRSNIDDMELLELVSNELSYTEYSITLDDLVNVFAGQTVTVTVSGWVRNEGEVTVSLSRPVWMPVRVARDARDQLDKCLAEYGWLPELESTPRTEITKEDVKKVLEWRKQNID